MSTNTLKIIENLNGSVYICVACNAKQPKMLNRQILRASFEQFGQHLLFGSLIILGGLFLYMTIVISIGYLPYSDRPGPGWYKKPFGISWDEMTYIGSFVLFLGIYI